MKKKVLKIAIYGANPYNGNKGVAALAYSALFLVDEIVNRLGVNPEFYLLHSDSGETKADFIEFDQLKVYFQNIEPINVASFRSLIRFLITPRQWFSVKHYFKFDCILNLGGGDSFSDIYGTTRFKSINSQNFLSRVLRKKYALLPQTIGPFFSESVKKKALLSLRKSSLVMPRDRDSYIFVKKNIERDDIDEFIDMAFYLPFKRSRPFKEGVSVGLNVSALCWNGGYTKRNQFGLKVDYQKLIRIIINKFLASENVTLVLVPHVVHERENIENDYFISLKLYDEFKSPRLKLAPFFLDPISAKSFISGLDFFVGSRMHSTIAAISAGVPIFPLAYSRKFDGLFRGTCKYDAGGDMTEQCEKEIVENLENAFKNRDQLKEIINNQSSLVIANRESLLKAKLTSFFRDLL
ncbi:polysaccharide pyruvyl transferase family protein [bacterium]|nr:polysaccharide pyruvyl transferase family protein [bacterium]